MKFNLIAKHAGDESKPWTEDYDYPHVTTVEEAEQTGRDMIARFNSTLRPGERAREFVGIEMVEGDTERHDWTKTNLVTINGPSGTYDAMRCNSCGITGKRYGLSSSVTLDSKFRAKAFQRCDTSKLLLAKQKGSLSNLGPTTQ